jgi:hypothetical protein
LDNFSGVDSSHAFGVLYDQPAAIIDTSTHSRDPLASLLQRNLLSRQ